MPSNIIKTINRNCIAVISTVEFGFAAIEIEKQSSDILIYDLSFGCVLTSKTDQTNYISQYAAILRNASLDTNFTAVPLSPDLIVTPTPAGMEQLWMESNSQCGSNNTKQFGAKPFILPGGNNYLIYASVPAFSAARNATVYVHLSVNAEVSNNNSNIAAGWRLR